AERERARDIAASQHVDGRPIRSQEVSNGPSASESVTGCPESSETVTTSHSVQSSTVLEKQTPRARVNGQEPEQDSEPVAARAAPETLKAVQAELVKAGILMAGGESELALEIDRYCDCANLNAVETVPRLFEAFGKESATWDTPKPPTPYLVTKALRDG